MIFLRKYLVCITVLVVTLILVFTNCNKAKQLENSSFFSDDEYIYYTNTLGDLYKYSFYNKSKEKIMDELYLRAFSDKYFIGYNENTIKIFNRINKKISFLENIKTSSIAVFNDDIFYVNENDNRYIYKLNINSMENAIFLNEKTNKLSVNKDYIFYEKILIVFICII